MLCNANVIITPIPIPSRAVSPTVDEVRKYIYARNKNTIKVTKEAPIDILSYLPYFNITITDSQIRYEDAYYSEVPISLTLIADVSI